MALSGFDSSKTEGINEINITPFVDVVLVLLVIFMVTAPMISKDVIGLNLPKTKSTESQDLSTLAIAVTKDGQVLVNGELTSIDGLQNRAREEYAKNNLVQAVLSGDVEAKHGDIMKVIDAIKTAGIENFAIQVEKTHP